MYKIISPISSLKGEAIVDKLMLPSKLAWDLDLLQQLFSIEEASIISTIPLSIVDRSNKITWAYTLTGNHLVGSAYHLSNSWSLRNRAESSNGNNQEEF